MGNGINPTSSHRKLPTGGIIGIILGTLFLISAIVLLLFFFIKRKKETDEENEISEKENNEGDNFKDEGVAEETIGLGKVEDNLEDDLWV